MKFVIHVVRVYRTQLIKAKASALFGIFPSLAGEEGGKQGWAKLVLIALKRYSVALKRLTFNLR